MAPAFQHVVRLEKVDMTFGKVADAEKRGIVVTSGNSPLTQPEKQYDHPEGHPVTGGARR